MVETRLRSSVIQALVVIEMTTAGYRSIGAVDGHGVGVDEFVVVDGFIFVGAYGQGLLVEVDGGDDAEGAVEDVDLALVLVVADLGDLGAYAEGPAAGPPFRLPVSGGVRCYCSGVLRARAPAGPRCIGRGSGCRGGVDVEFGGDAAAGDVDGECGGGFRVVAREEDPAGYAYLDPAGAV
jgi:hypothetical protein